MWGKIELRIYSLLRLLLEKSRRLFWSCTYNIFFCSMNNAQFKNSKVSKAEANNSGFFLAHDKLVLFSKCRLDFNSKSFNCLLIASKGDIVFRGRKNCFGRDSGWQRMPRIFGKGAKETAQKKHDMGNRSQKNCCLNKSPIIFPLKNVSRWAICALGESSGTPKEI